MWSIFFFQPGRCSEEVSSPVKSANGSHADDDDDHHDDRGIAELSQEL